MGIMIYFQMQFAILILFQFLTAGKGNTRPDVRSYTRPHMGRCTDIINVAQYLPNFTSHKYSLKTILFPRIRN
jgi:hypothetical protein